MVALWWWLGVLLITSVASLSYYIILLTSSSVTWRDRFLAIAINDTKEFQGGITQGEVNLEEEVHKFLKDLPPTKFFFLYFVGHNLDYRSLKILAQRITDIKLRPPSYATSQRDHQSRHGSLVSMMSARTSSSQSVMRRLEASPRLRLKSISSLGPHPHQHQFSRSESSSPHPEAWILGDDEDSLPSYSKTISGPPTSRTGISTFSFDHLK